MDYNFYGWENAVASVSVIGDADGPISVWIAGKHQ